MRSVRSEFLFVATALAVPVGIVLSFPFDAFRFRAEEGESCPVRTAFVTLTPEVERQALRAVRVPWKGKIGEARRLRVDLFCVELPEESRISVLSLRDRSRLPEPPLARPERTPFLPSQKAPPPSPIAAENAVVPLPFPREELLKIN